MNLRMGMTPQAPWTKNCMKKPAGSSPFSVVGRIQAGIKHMEITAAPTMARRLPMNWERYPMMVPPTHAPVFMRIDARDAPALSRPF